jgi:hypothetical protein
MLAKTQLANPTTQELEDLRNRIEGELTRRELSAGESPEGRQVVEEKQATAGTLRLERVKCGKTRCKKCKEGEGHGPYWYLYYRRSGKLDGVKTSLGWLFNPADVELLANERLVKAQERLLALEAARSKGAAGARARKSGLGAEGLSLEVAQVPKKYKGSKVSGGKYRSAVTGRYVTKSASARARSIKSQLREQGRSFGDSTKIIRRDRESR